MEKIGSYNFLLTFLLGGTILIGLFMILILLKSKALKIARFFLAGLLLFLTLHLLTLLLFTTKIIVQFPHLLGVTYPTIYLFGPAFFFFVRSYHNDTFKLKLLDLLHLIPFVFFLATQIPSYLSSSETKLKIINYILTKVPDSMSFALWFQYSLFMLLLLIYTLISLKYLHQKYPKNQVLLKRFSYVLILLAISYLIMQTGLIVHGISAMITEIILASLLSITILLLGFWLVDIKHVIPVLDGKYKTSPLSENEINSIEMKLKNALENDKLYLNVHLKIADLSKKTNIPKHHISQVLNEQMQFSFYDFINTYRINEAKKLLKNGITQKLSIQAVGQECGFSNKTSFYRAFKKFTKTTPNEFLKTIH